MRFFQDGLSGLYIMKAFKAVLAEEFESGERRLASRVDPSIRSLMIGKGSAAFEVAAVVFDLPLRDCSKESFIDYLATDLRIRGSALERASHFRFPVDGSESFILPLILQRELTLVGAAGAAANIAKYLRGFEISGFVMRTPTGYGSEMAYRCTEKIHALADMVEEYLDKEELVS